MAKKRTKTDNQQRNAAKKVEDLAPGTNEARKVKGGIEWTYRDPVTLGTKAGGEVISADASLKAR